MKAGQPVDPAHGLRAKPRRLHNTYFGLPVRVAMLSNHCAFVYSAQHKAVVLGLLMAAGALIRHSFVAQRRALVQGLRVPWEYATIGVALLIGTAVWLKQMPMNNATQITDGERDTLRRWFEVAAAVH